MGEIDLCTNAWPVSKRLHQRMGELDNVEERLATVDGLAAQLQQLNARVAAQAELGGQLSTSARSRRSDSPISPAVTGDDDMRLQLQEIGERLRAHDEMQAQVARLPNGPRRTTPKLGLCANTWRCSISD